MRTAQGNDSQADALNVFYYRVLTQSGAVDAEGVADAFIEDILPHFAVCLPSLWTINQVFTQNMMLSTDWNDTNPDETGVRTGTPLPSFLAGSVRSPWPGSGFNRARKRVPGFVTSDINGNGQLIDGGAVALNNVAAALSNHLVLTGGELGLCTVTPAQPGADPPVPFAFRAMCDGDWEYTIRITTQSSRKIEPNFVPHTGIE
jgi:hypothetical protein